MSGGKYGSMGKYQQLAQQVEGAEEEKYTPCLSQYRVSEEDSKRLNDYIKATEKWEEKAVRNERRGRAAPDFKRYVTKSLESKKCTIL